jgi:hypothetical protein
MPEKVKFLIIAEYKLKIKAEVNRSWVFNNNKKIKNSSNK